MSSLIHFKSRNNLFRNWLLFRKEIRTICDRLNHHIKIMSTIFGNLWKVNLSFNLFFHLVQTQTCSKNTSIYHSCVIYSKNTRIQKSQGTCEVIQTNPTENEHGLKQCEVTTAFVILIKKCDIRGKMDIY